MEHLFDSSQLDGIQAAIPENPWLEFDHDTSQQFPVTSFEEYPLRRGWTTARLQELRQGFLAEDTEVPLTLAMLQSWLFFGLLESAFQQHFPTSLFIACPEGTSTRDQRPPRCLNTKHLRKFYQRWHLDFLDLPQHKQNSFSASFARSLPASRDWALSLEVKFRHRVASHGIRPLSIVLNAIIRNTMLLTELLGKAVPGAFPDSGFVNQQFDLDPGGEISHRLQQGGWCPSIARMLMNKYGHSVVMYASILRPVEQPHVRHNACDRLKCVAYNIDVSTYSPQHMHQGCSCEHIIPPQKDVYDILQSGKFPVMDGNSIITDGQQGELIVRRYEEDMQYLAFSHVWSDGLGSVTEKGLPRCQVAHLINLCRAMTGSTLFWIDSLCVPKGSPTRTAAIHLMATTYAKASTTIILDYGLRQCSNSATIEEISVRILTCVWLRRLWTLQEAALAYNLVFLLRDAFLPLPHLLSRTFTSGFSGPISAALLSELSGFDRSLYATRPAHISHVQRLMGYRTSSRIEDETLAIAPLFHLDVSTLTSHKSEARTVVFWKGLQTAPSDVIFSDAPRLTTPGFRWVPQTLMHGDANVFGPKKGQITERGLVGEFDVFEFAERIAVEKDKARCLLDVTRKRAFRVLHWAETVSCDMIAFRQQSTGDLIPGAGVILERESDKDRHDHEAGQVPVFKFAARAIITVDEVATLVPWGSEQPSNAIIVRSRTKLVCIS